MSAGIPGAASRWMTVWMRLRLALGCLCAVLAFHVVVLIDTRLSWQLTLLATEYGHRSALAAMLCAGVGLWRHGRTSLMGTILLLASTAVLLMPVVRMSAQLKRLPADMEAAFGLPREKPEDGPSPAALWLGWNKPAEATPETFVYASSDGKSQHICFYRAASRRPAPCLLVFHGGGWVNGQATEFSQWSSYWSRQGYAVASVEYRLVPAHRWPAPLEDARDAMAWIKAQARELGVDPTQFIMLGRSAGGQIASAAAVSLKDPAIRGCVAIYAPHDMFFARRFAFDDDVLGSLSLIRNYLGGDPEVARDAYTSASAYLLADAHTCPMLLLHGTRDTFVWNMQSRRLAARLKSLGVPHHLVELPWAVHGFDWPFDGPGGCVTRVAVDRFLKTVLHRR